MQQGLVHINYLFDIQYNKRGLIFNLLKYVYMICRSFFFLLKGFLIFVLHCARNNQVRGLCSPQIITGIQIIPGPEMIPDCTVNDPRTENVAITDGNVWTQEFRQWIKNLYNRLFYCETQKTKTTLISFKTQQFAAYVCGLFCSRLIGFFCATQ